ncbi:major capsid protein [Chryseomicrobium palamuruense]
MPPELLNLEQALTGSELLTYAGNLPAPQNYLADLLFPSRETSELTVDVIREASRLPVMAQIGELGTQAEYGSREGAVASKIQIPKIQRARAMDEKLVRLLLQEGLRPNEFAEIRRTQLDDVSYTVDAIRARKEWIAMQAISTGAVTYAEGGVQFAVDFGFTSAQKPVLTGQDLWSDTVNSKPLEDLYAWTSAAADRGILLTRAMTSRQIITHLRQNLSIRQAYHGKETAPNLKLSELNELMAAENLPLIAEYDTVARVEGRAAVNGRPSFSNVRMMPQNRFVLLPDGPLGDYLWAQTTEEMMSEIEAAETAEDGIYVFRKLNEHPIRVETIGVNLAFPAFGYNDAVVAATVI